MKLWLVWQNEANGYDTYDSIVVAAETEEEARDISPMQYKKEVTLIDWEKAAKDNYSSWATKRENVKVELLGQAAEGTKAGLILASFNAG